jgi:hypothetical protein
MTNPLTNLPVSVGSAAASVGDASATLSGVLHVFVAFDWGDEIDLTLARRLVPAEIRDLSRRRRTPSSITYKPLPLRFTLATLPLTLPEIGEVTAHAEATVFDFAAVSLDMNFPFQVSASCLSRLAGWLADATPLVQVGRNHLKPLYDRLLPAIHRARWQDDLSEEYVVFQLPPSLPPLVPEILVRENAGWLAGLLRLEDGSLSKEEINEALRLHISYSPSDLVVLDWAAAVVLDKDCEETLEIIEFGNLQLLELRHIDNRLDATQAEAYHLVAPRKRMWLPFMSSPARSLRSLGGLNMEANGLFERTANVLKLVGDQYLARVYKLLGTRFHLEEWGQSIQRKLDVLEGVYQVLSDQVATYRTEVLESIVIILIVLEIVLALVRH